MAAEPLNPKTLETARTSPLWISSGVPHTLESWQSSFTSLMHDVLMQRRSVAHQQE